MADFSIDQNRLPGVKEVCRDFAVLEDHCLAHNLQEQEIESHLASNINRSRLVQQDLLVAKRLQEEEDLRAKEKQKKQHHELEQIDSEMAHVIQEQLVRQAEQQRQQEEKDEAIARRLQEKEKKRQKQLEARVEEEYYDEKGAHRIPSDSGYPSPEYSRKKQLDAGRRRYPEYDPPEQGSPRRHESPGLDRYQDRRGRNPDYWPSEGRQRQGEQRGGHRASEEDWEDKLVVRKKDKPSRPPPPKYPTERDRDQDRERKRDKERGTERGERDGERDGHRTQSRDRLEMREADRDRDRERRRDKERGRVGQRDGERDGHRTRSRDRLEMREPDRDRDREAERDRHGHWRQEDYNRSREQNGDRDRDGGRDCKESRNGHRDRDGDRDGDRVVYMYETRDGVKKHHNGRMRSRDMEHEERTGSWSGDEEPRNHLRLPSDPGEVFEEPIYPRSPKREALDLDSDVQRGRTHSRDLYSFSDSPLDRGRGGRGDFGVVEAQQALSRMALREQELQEMRDMEVARQLQEHELKASQMNQRAAQAAQVAQDEEIARMLMEEEKKVFKKAREREREKAPVDRRKPEADWRPSQEEALQPRSREEYDPQRARHQKPSRPAPPHTQNYENVQAGYGYPEPHYPARPATRPDIAYKGSYYKQ